MNAKSRLELVAVVLLSVTALVTSWSAFQSSKWNGVMAIRYNEASASRAESIRLTDEAAAREAADTALVTPWLNALLDNDPARARRHYERFRGVLRTSADAWLAVGPLTNPDAPASPLFMPQYQPASRAEADRLRLVAEHRSEQARQANQRSDNYVLISVLLASVLLFAGVSTKLSQPANQIALLCLGALVFAVAVGIELTYPVEL